MPPRVAYWVSSFETGMEACAKEMALLRAHFPGSALWGVSQTHPFSLSRKHGLVFTPRLQLLFRATTALLQKRYDINHLIGGLNDWFHLRAVRRHPTVLTIAVDGEPTTDDLLWKVNRFVIEWPAARRTLHELGIADEKISLVYPPVDLQQFAPAPPPVGPFTVVFASSPDRAEHLEGRGAHLILEAAQLRPKMRFALCWRPWGDALPRMRTMIEHAKVNNVELTVGKVTDMSSVYRGGHVTVFCMTDPRVSKPAPNSVIEALACGRPVVVTPVVGVAELIEQSGAGQVVAPTGEALAEALDVLQANWTEHARQARATAEQHFDQRHFISAYARIYDEVR